jgi:tetratricopeptide (TPR) repeat protein
LGATEADQIFIDGLMETITSKLTQLEQFHGSMWVVPASVIREKEAFNIGQARKKFGVTLAITGSVQSFNDDRRLTLNLVDTKSERQISSAVIDNIFTDVSALQDSTVLELARMLEIHLQPKDQKFLVAGGTFNLDAYHFYVKGRGYLQYHEKMENIDSALVSFQKALNEDQHFALAYAGLGEAYWRKYAVLADTNLEKLAIYNSQRALDENNTLAPVYVTLGLILKGAGRYEEALEEFRVALRLDSVNYDASCGMAKTYKALNMIILAESTYIDAIHAKPDYWAGYYNLGLFYLESGRHEDALNQLKIAERLDHDGYDAWNNIGVLFYGLGRSQDALLMWNRSIAIEPNYGAYSNLGSLFYIQRRYAEAADAFKKALSLDSNDYRVWINYASVLDKLVGEENRAIITYRKAANMAEIQRNINPRNVEVLSNLATCYSFLGEKSKAQLLIDQALSISPKDLEVLVTAASIYDNMGERSIAVSYIAKAINGGYPLTQLKTYQDLTELLKDPGLDSMLTGI